MILADCNKVLAIVSTGFNVPEVLSGYGQHLYYLSEEAIIQSLKWNYLATPLLVFSLSFSKISICLFLVRLLDRTNIRFRISFPYFLIALSLANAILSAGYALGQCQPVRKLWNHAIPGHCQDPKIYVNIGYTNGAINVFGDFSLAAFPITFIKDLHFPLRKKVILYCLMSCGVICGAIAIARTVLTGDLATKSDITWDSVNSSILALTEENVSIVVACVPTLGVIYTYFRTKVTTRGSRSSGNSPHTGQKRRGHTLLDSIHIPLRTATPFKSGRTKQGMDLYCGYSEDPVPALYKTMEFEVERTEVERSQSVV